MSACRGAVPRCPAGNRPMAADATLIAPNLLSVRVDSAKQVMNSTQHTDNTIAINIQNI
jgi:hypothetical protein